MAQGDAMALPIPSTLVTKAAASYNGGRQ